jgi:RNA polymerase sigma-70 factor (ECF subfamily)
MSSMSPRDPIEFEELVIQVAWARNLALAIVRDARGASNSRAHRDVHSADDLAQDAFVAALKQRPSASEPLAAWFSRVMRNLVRFKARSDSHRLEREAHAARPERDDSGELAMERLETQEALLRAVRELDEPYRTTVILRWFENLEPAEIARRSNVPVRTVHTRITRALRMLRERLDRRSRGDRAAWMSAWIPLLSKPAAPWPWIIAMDMKLKIAIAGVVAVGALTALYHYSPANGSAIVSSTARPSERTAALDAPEIAREPEASRAPANESPRDAPPTPEAASTAVDPSLFDLDALVLEPGGAPVADLDVEFRSSGSSSALARARSGADGSLHLRVASSKGTLAPASSEWTTVLEPRIQPFRHPSRYVLVVAHPISVAGRVVDERKRPVAGAEVRCSPPPIRERLALVLDDSAWIPWKSITDADGRFRLTVVPAMADAQLVTEAAGFARDAREMPLASRTDVEIELKWPPDDPAHVRGRVVDARNAGVAGAYVAIGKRSTRTDAAGRFDFDLDHKPSFSVATSVSTMSKSGAATESTPLPPEERTLRALKQGFLPVELTCATPSPRDIGAWPNPLLLVLDTESLTIAGRVVDDLGAPVVKADVRVLDISSFIEVEHEAGEKMNRQMATIESLLSTRSDGQMGWLSTKTDAQGRFVHDGLLAKPYRLRAFDPTTMAVLIAAPCVPPQADLELVLANPSRHARIAGHVVDRDGQPIAGASVTPSIFFAGTADKIGLYGSPVGTDGEGRFDLRGLSRDVDELLVSLKDSPDSKTVLLAKEENVESITVQMARGCHLQVDLSGSHIEADAFAVFDEKGKMLGFLIQRPEMTLSGEQFLPLVDGRSEAVGTSDAARKLVLTLHGEKVAEIPIQLTPGRLNVIRP